MIPLGYSKRSVRAAGLDSRTGPQKGGLGFIGLRGLGFVFRVEGLGFVFWLLPEVRGHKHPEGGKGEIDFMGVKASLTPFLLASRLFTATILKLSTQ